VAQREGSLGAGSATVPPVARRVVLARALRGLIDGLVSVLLAGYLSHLGFSPFQIGAIVTGTLFGSALLTILLGLIGHRVALRRVLLGASVLMVATGLAFAGLQSFWPLLIAAVLGTLNPSAGDVTVFLPAEQAVLAQAVPAPVRTSVFAWYNVCGTFAGGIGSLFAGAPAVIAAALSSSVILAERASFVLYAGIGGLVAALYRGLPRVALSSTSHTAVPLARSRRTVLHLAALFSLDSFGGGFVVQSLLVLWLHQRFGLSVVTTAQIFFVAGLAAGLSQLVSARLAARIGYVRTMVYTHLPANVFLMLAGVVSSAPLAVGFLLLRSALSQMDVPARQAYVMAVVSAEERPAAASLTNVPRSLASALSPLLAGLMLDYSGFGWPLVCGGAIKALYDVLLLAAFRAREPIE
jgi:MFS family permease